MKEEENKGTFAKNGRMEKGSCTGNDDSAAEGGRTEKGAGRAEREIPGFDAGYKQELSKPPQFIHFMQKYVKADWCRALTPEQVELCDKEFVLEDYQKRIADLVYKIHLPETELYVYLIMELQSTVDFTMPFRLLTLIFGLLLKIFLETPEKERERKEFRLPAVLPVLFYNGERRWGAETEFRRYLKEYRYFGEYSLNFQYYLVDLSQVANDDILNTNTLIDNILALDKNRKSERLGDILDSVMKRMEELGENDRISFQKWLEYVLLASANKENEEAVKQLIEMIREGKGETKMIHGIQVIIRDEYNRGVNDGKEEGREEGRAEGESQKLVQQICKKLRKGKTAALIAEELEEDLSVILSLCEIALNYGPDYDEKSVFEAVMRADFSGNGAETGHGQS